MRVRYMLDDEVIAERIMAKVASLPKVGDRQNIRSETDAWYLVLYVHPPLPGTDLAVVGLKEPV